MRQPWWHVFHESRCSGAYLQLVCALFHAVSILFQARNGEAEGKEAGPAELMRKLRSVEALPGYREASEHLGRLHSVEDHRPGLVDPVLGQGRDVEGLGRHAEGLREGTPGGPGRALAANVLWLDANPDAKSDLARARPGAVSTSVPVWSYITVCLATKVLLSVRLGQAEVQKAQC